MFNAALRGASLVALMKAQKNGFSAGWIAVIPVMAGLGSSPLIKFSYHQPLVFSRQTSYCTDLADKNPQAEKTFIDIDKWITDIYEWNSDIDK